MINVVIARASKDIIWEGIEWLLSNVTDIDISSVDSETALIGMLNSGYPQILILDKLFGSHNESNYKYYFEQRPGLGIIVISPDTGEMILHLQNVGCELLVKQIQALATEIPESEKNNCLSRLQYLSTDKIKELLVKPAEIKESSNTGYANTREHLSAICKWIDLSLHRYFAREIKSGNEVNAPGWAMSADRARGLLGKDFARVKEDELSRMLELFEKRMAEKEEANSLGSGFSKFVALFDSFNLNNVERQIFLFTIAPELDGRYAQVFGYLNDDLTRRRPTPSILNQLINRDEKLAWDIQQIIAGEGALGKYQLLSNEVNDTLPKSEVGLKCAADILTYLLSEDDYFSQYHPALEIHQASNLRKITSHIVQGDLTEKLRHWNEMLISGRNSIPIMQLVGNNTTLNWFKQNVIGAGETVVIVNLELMNPVDDSNFIDLIHSAIRLAKLHDAILTISGLKKLQVHERHQFEKLLATEICKRINRLVIHCKDPLVIHGIPEIWQIRRNSPSYKARESLWITHARLAGIELSESEAALLAATIRFDESEIEATLSLCRSETDKDNILSSIQSAARKVARTMVPSMVRRLETRFDWKDIVLPESTLAILKQISAHVWYASKVFEDWGYDSRLPYGSGVSALFSGPSGTGKTMTAQIIARELGVELFQVDLANTVSKYIGETEKNLDIIFNAAEQASAVLLFDEADALFGKRTEVKDAHDRYANVEVAYLLQRIEAYSGLALLTTNFRQNLDSAFLRRLRFVIDFPAPSAKYREAIWRCVFPAAVQFADNVDTTFLARRLELTGGHIQQIAVRAAFSAAAEGGNRIAMKHIVQATREELIKLGMLSAERNLNEWSPMLAGGETT